MNNDDWKFHDSRGPPKRSAAETASASLVYREFHRHLILASNYFNKRLVLVVYNVMEVS